MSKCEVNHLKNILQIYPITTSLLKHLTIADVKKVLLAYPEFAKRSHPLFKLFLDQVFLPFCTRFGSTNWLGRYSINPILLFLVQKATINEILHLTDSLEKLDLRKHRVNYFNDDYVRRIGLEKESKMPNCQFLAGIPIHPKHPEPLRAVLPHYHQTNYGVLPRLSPCMFILKNGKLAPVPGPHCYFEDKQMLLHEALMGIRDDVGAPLIEEIELSEEKKVFHDLKGEFFSSHEETFQFTEKHVPLFEIIILLHHMKFHKCHYNQYLGAIPTKTPSWIQLLELSSFVSLLDKYALHHFKDVDDK